MGGSFPFAHPSFRYCTARWLDQDEYSSPLDGLDLTDQVATLDFLESWSQGVVERCVLLKAAGDQELEEVLVHFPFMAESLFEGFSLSFNLLSLNLLMAGTIAQINLDDGTQRYPDLKTKRVDGHTTLSSKGLEEFVRTVICADNTDFIGQAVSGAQQFASADGDLLLYKLKELLAVRRYCATALITTPSVLFSLLKTELFHSWDPPKSFDLPIFGSLRGLPVYVIEPIAKGQHFLASGMFEHRILMVGGRASLGQKVFDEAPVQLVPSPLPGGPFFQVKSATWVNSKAVAVGTLQ